MSSRSKLMHDPESVFNDLRLEGTFCDAVIRVEDVDFPVHKVFLCSCSPYFLTLFKLCSHPDKKVFDIPGLTPKMMQLIIEHAYSRSVTVTEDNVQELLVAADHFNVMDIVETCCEFLTQKLCAENCVGIYQLTTMVLCDRLHCKADQYITEHFEEVSLTEEFLQLTVEELKDILGRDDLCVRKESTVFEAILRWISHAPAERGGHIAGLLSKVRLALTNMDYMQMNVMSNELVRNNPECQPVVNEAMDTIRHNINRPRVSCRCNSLSRPRLPSAILLAISGWSGDAPTYGIEAYDIRADYWVNVTDDHEGPRGYHGTAFLNGYVYCVGGFDMRESFNSMCRYDLGTCTWQEVAPMHFRRSDVSVTVLNGFIYAIGGYNGQRRLKTAERYCPDNNQWSLIAPMHERRELASCTTLHNKVYICGGFNGNVWLQTAECYNPDTNQWSMIAPMTCIRGGVGVMAYADRVYAVGGFDGTSRLTSVEAYNPDTNTWHNVSSMNTSRSNFGIEVLEDLLFVVGGFGDDSNPISDVEYYDATTKRWTEACEIDYFRSGVSCCVVSKFPNMANYVISRDALPLLQLKDVLLESEESA